MARYRSLGWFAGKAQARLHELYYRSPVSKWVTSRQAQIYCVGTAKSGTHSLASLFSDELRTFHEADWQAVIKLILASAETGGERRALRRRLLERDRQFALDIDSSQLNYFYLPELLELFPNSKFVLTIREPRSWLDSLINHQLARGTPPPEWRRLRDFRFARDGAEHPPEEAALKARGLYTLDGYLSYWRRHNQDVIRLVPPEKLLVVRTDQISQRADDIARFAGLPQRGEPAGKTAGKAAADKSHTFKALKKFGVLGELEPEYLDEKIRQHCSELVSEFFPDALPSRALAEAKV